MFCENPTGFVNKTDSVSLDWVRLALPRSPESGVAVSTGAKFLSREKRKIWPIFFLYVYILWGDCYSSLRFVSFDLLFLVNFASKLLSGRSLCKFTAHSFCRAPAVSC